MEAPNLVQIFGSYTSWKLDEQTWMISFMNGSQFMFLLEGDEKALLVDTGWGAGNVRAYVEKLTDKPIEVINTHFHPDHAGSNGEFEKVYVSAAWEKDAKSLEGCPFDLSALPYPNYEKVIVGTGDVIDLGGRQIEVIDARPAHCNSTLFLFDRTHGMYFAGDDFETAQTLMFDTSSSNDPTYGIRERLDNMRANAADILALKDQIKYLLPNHNGAPIAMSYIEDYIGIVDHIYAGDAIIEDKLNHPFVEKDPIASEGICRVRWGKASIFSIKKQIMSVYGK